MSTLILVIRSNEEAEVVHATLTARGKQRTVRQALTAFIEEGKKLDTKALYTRASNNPLTVAIEPQNLEDIVALGMALTVVPITDLIGAIKRYIAATYPEQSVEIQFAGVGQLTRMRNVLQRNHLWTVDQVRAKSNKELLDLDGINQISLARIRQITAPKKAKKRH